MRYKRRLFRICAVSLFFTIACIAQGNAAEKLAPHSNLVVGDCNLWHNTFFLGELPEFNRSVLEVMRQAFEERIITIRRAKYTIEYPCSFMFVASMNPCPCGYYGDPTHHCVCSPGQIQRYMNKISGPLLDRIDIRPTILLFRFYLIYLPSQTGKYDQSNTIRQSIDYLAAS